MGRPIQRPELEEQRAKDRARYAADPARKLATNKRSRERNLDQRRADARARYRQNGGREYARKIRATPQGALANRLRSRIWHALRLSRGSKAFSSEELLGASIADVRLWLEMQFKPGMTWENMGEWHIDHIKPCSAFDLTDPLQQLECFNWRNLQPLWAAENLSKNDKY